MNLQQLRELKKNQQQKSLGKTFLEANGEHTTEIPTKIWTPNDGPKWLPDPKSLIVIDEYTRTIGCECEACRGVPDGVFMVLQDDEDGTGRLRTCSFIPNACPLCGKKLILDEKAFCKEADRYILSKGVV